MNTHDQQASLAAREKYRSKYNITPRDIIDSAGGVVGMYGDELVLVVDCLIWFPVINKEAVLRDEPLDYLRASSENTRNEGAKKSA